MMWSNTSHLTQATTDLSSALRESVFQVLSCRDSEGVIGCRTLGLDKRRPQVLMTNSCFVTEATLALAVFMKNSREIMQILLQLYLAEHGTIMRSWAGGTNIQHSVPRACHFLAKTPSPLSGIQCDYSSQAKNL